MSTILFLKARDWNDTGTHDMFGGHVETRTRKDGVVQKYHVADVKKTEPATHDSRREALSAFDGERSDGVAMKRDGKWIAVHQAEAGKHAAQGWVDPSGSQAPAAMSVAASLRDLAGARAGSIDFDGIAYLKNTVGLKGLSDDESRSVGNAISMISHMRDTSRLSGTHMLAIRDKMRGKAVLDMVEKVASRMKEVADPLDAVREFFNGKDPMAKSIIFLR